MSHGDMYILVEHIESKKIFRYLKFAENQIPEGYRKIYKYKHSEVDKEFDVYDKSGKLDPRFWAVERITSYKGEINYGK